MCEKTECNDLFENSILYFCVSLFARHRFGPQPHREHGAHSFGSAKLKAISRVDLCRWVVVLDWHRTTHGCRKKNSSTYKVRCTDVRMYYPIAVQHSGKRVYFRWRQHQHLVSIKKIIAHNMSSFKWQQIAFRFSYSIPFTPVHIRSRITISIVQ